MREKNYKIGRLHRACGPKKTALFLFFSALFLFLLGEFINYMGGPQDLALYHVVCAFAIVCAFLFSAASLLVSLLRKNFAYSFSYLFIVTIIAMRFFYSEQFYLVEYQIRSVYYGFDISGECRDMDGAEFGVCYSFGRFPLVRFLIKWEGEDVNVLKQILSSPKSELSLRQAGIVDFTSCGGLQIQSVNSRLYYAVLVCG
jgi:hypothetical protein